MKLTLVQIVLGVLVAAACCYIQSQVRTTVPWLEGDSSGNIAVVMLSAGATLIAAHWLAVLTIVLGLSVSVTGIIYFRKKRASPGAGLKTLFKISLVLGAAIVLTSVLVDTWGFPTSLTRMLPDGRMATQFWLESHHAAFARLLDGLVFLSGVIILVCGIAGVLKNRRQRNPCLSEADGLPETYR